MPPFKSSAFSETKEFNIPRIKFTILQSYTFFWRQEPKVLRCEEEFKKELKREQTSKKASKQEGKKAGKQASKQSSKQALRRHSVGAMPCRGLFTTI